MLNAHSDHLKRWDTILVAAGTNSSEPGFEDLRFQLEAASEAVKNMLAHQALLRSQLQEATRELEALMVNGKEAYSRLSLVVKGRYGPRAEKLAEFGLQPLRPHPRSKEKETPPETGRSAPRAAIPETGSSN
jgi:hypothetical protein